MKTKTAELTGRALDWAAAKCVTLAASNGDLKLVKLIDPRQTPRYSTDWSQGGPIIEREKVDVTQQGGSRKGAGWQGSKGAHLWQFGPTPLIAAMRCYVASKLGDEIDIPDELL